MATGYVVYKVLESLAKSPSGLRVSEMQKIMYENGGNNGPRHAIPWHKYQNKRGYGCDAFYSYSPFMMKYLTQDKPRGKYKINEEGLKRLLFYKNKFE